jgi:hypothetical protein
MKPLTILKNKIFYYPFILAMHPLLLYLLLMIIYLMLFIYHAEPVLCAGLNEAGEASGVNQTFPCETKEAQQSLADSEIIQRLKELKAFSENNSQQINDRLNALYALLDNDIKMADSTGEKYKY